MFPKGEVKRSLLGALEIALFMKQGAERFSADAGAMLRSFIPGLALMPLSYLALYYMQREDPILKDFSYSFVALIFSIKIVLATVLFLGFVYAILRSTGREAHFFTFIAATNWSGIIPVLLFVPLLGALIFGTHGWTDIYPLSLCITIYGYVYTAFLATFVLRVPWEMAGFIAICGLAINQTTLDILYWITDRL